MKETPIFKGPLPEGNDTPAGMEQISLAVEWVESLLEQIEGLILGEPKPGDLLIVNGTSDPVYKALTADLTVNSAGVATIANLAVTAAKIADKAVETAKLADLGVTEAKLAALAVTTAKLAAEAVTTGKLAPEAVTTAKIALLAITEGLIADGAVTSRKAKLTSGIVECNEEKVLGEAFVDVPGAVLEITPAVASILKVTAIFSFTSTGEGDEGIGTMKLDAEADHARLAEFGARSAKAGLAKATVAQVYRFALTAAEKHTLKMRAKKIGAASVLSIKAAQTCFMYELTAS